MPTMWTMFFSWLLLTHIPTLPTTSADVLCIPEIVSLAPPTADCRRIIANMPSLSESLTSEIRERQDLHSYNSPFLPRALFGHGDCITQVFYFSGSEPARHADWIDDPPPPRIALSQTSIFKLWTVIRAAAEELVDVCIAQQRTGSIWNVARVSEIKGAWVLVEIFLAPRPWWRADSLTEQARLARLDTIYALTDSSRGAWGREPDVRTKYEVTLLGVP